MPNLRIIFSGLCGYVERARDGKKQLGLLLPNIPKPSFALTKTGGLLIFPAHLPFIVIKERYLGESPRQPDYAYSEYGASERNYLFFLGGGGGEVLTVATGYEPSGVTFFRDDTIKEGQPKPDESLDQAKYDIQKRDARWMADMGKAFPGCGPIDRDCMETNLKKLLAVRMDLDQGEVGTHKLGGERKSGNSTVASIYTFKKSEGVVPDYSQALAEQVYIDIPFAEEARIQSKAFDGNDGQKDLVLKAKDGVILCYVSNSELDQIIRPKYMLYDSRNARDFLALYELAQVRPPNSERRFPVTDEGTAGERICPGGKFTAD
jgi:hypothetical protein